jgi:hypothetical protein
MITMLHHFAQTSADRRPVIDHRSPAGDRRHMLNQLHAGLPAAV